MDGGALASPIGATATAVAPTTPKGKSMRKRVSVTFKVKSKKRKAEASRVRCERRTSSPPTSGRGVDRMFVARRGTTITMIRALSVAAAAVVGGMLGASTASAVGPPPGSEFGISSFQTEVKDSTGADETRAGAHPYSAQARFTLEEYDPQQPLGKPFPIENPRTILTRLPAGFSGNPQAAEECPLGLVGAEARVGYLTLCPAGSWVGFVKVDGAIDVSQPVANVRSEVGFPAQFGFSEANQTYSLYAELRSDEDYGVNVVVPATNINFITGVTMTFCSWGVEVVSLTPGTAGSATFRCREEGEPGAFTDPFLTNPATECRAEAPVTDLEMDSWERIGIFTTARAVSPLITSCDTLEFEPSVDIAPTTPLPDAPTGLNVDMAFPQEDNAQGQAPPALKKAVVTLPEGMKINPSGAGGLQACADGELLLKSKDPMTCPEASKVGSVVAKSPLLDEDIEGGVYIRSQNSTDPESGEMFRLALVLQNKSRGVDVRLPGQVRVNSKTGRIEATFDNNPELPVDSLKLRFKDGPRAPLSMPATCGNYAIETVLTSWGKQTASVRSDFSVHCSAGLGGFNPGFKAGTADPTAGGFSAFSLAVTRNSGERNIESLQRIVLPDGLLGDVSSVELCGDAQADAGSCGAGSRVGHVQVAAGAGSTPLWVPQAGKQPTGVFLTGPYRGAPYGLSIKVPAQAGPFDLGTVVVRSALHVDERTAAITSGVDETRLIEPNGSVTQVLAGDLPLILKGVLLDQREIRVLVDRPGFIINPTDCSPQQVSAEVYSAQNDRVDVANRFRAVDCAKLGFKPRFNARILNKGRRSTLRSFHPRTQFSVVPRSGDANIGGARVALPSSTILDQSNIGTTCTRAQMADRSCPAKSVVGYARAWSPLLRKAVEGPVYLAANGGIRPLPDLAAVLDGEIRVVLQGEISTLRTGGRARLQNTFRVVPDAPVTRFALTMRGGKNTGLLVNSTDLCRSKARGVAVFNGQNGRQSRSALRLARSFKGCAKVRRQAVRKAAARKKARRAAARRAAVR